MNGAQAAVYMIGGLLELARRNEYVTAEEYTAALEMIPANAMDLCDLVVKMIGDHRPCLLAICVTQDLVTHKEELLRIWRDGEFNLIQTEMVIQAIDEPKKRPGFIRTIEMLLFIDELWKQIIKK